MKKHLLLWIAIGMAAMILVACGGGDQESTEEVEVAESTEQEVSTDPEDLAEEVYVNYMECMDQMRSILAGLPEPEVVKPQLEELKDEYIDVFVEIGYRVDAQDSMTVDEIGRDFWNRLRELDSEWMGEASSHYSSVDYPTAELIGEINIITQYAFFDLLRRQNPEEAERLGL